MEFTRWKRETAPSLAALRSALTEEGFMVSEWSDTPDTVYPVHSHEYAETRWVVSGEMRIGLPESGEEFVLRPGDRLEIPASALHWIDVQGHQPVICLIGTRGRSNGHHPKSKP